MAIFDFLSIVAPCSTLPLVIGTHGRVGPMAALGVSHMVDAITETGSASAGPFRGGKLTGSSCRQVLYTGRALELANQPARRQCRRSTICQANATNVSPAANKMRANTPAIATALPNNHKQDHRLRDLYGRSKGATSGQRTLAKSQTSSPTKFMHKVHTECLRR